MPSLPLLFVSVLTGPLDALLGAVSEKKHGRHPWKQDIAKTRLLKLTEQR